MTRHPLGKPHLLQDARAYLSGPMDFVASRADEKKFGWRTRVGQFLSALGVTVFDPWTKPDIRGFHQYGVEDETSTDTRKLWTFTRGARGARRRAKCAESFWPMLHVDLRMVDTSDFVVCYCPTNIYSVGTPHEIILCREQRKPVLFVSPYVDFPTVEKLRVHLKRRKDGAALALLKTIESEVPIKPNPAAVPSLWYLPLVGGEHFFDGFGFGQYRRRFRWRPIALDDHEKRHPPRKPLLPFLAALNRRLPKKWDRARGKFVTNDDWLFWELTRRAETRPSRR